MNLPISRALWTVAVDVGFGPEHDTVNLNPSPFDDLLVKDGANQQVA